jgi:hypothetical protein
VSEFLGGVGAVGAVVAVVVGAEGAVGVSSLLSLSSHSVAHAMLNGLSGIVIGTLTLCRGVSHDAFIL